MLEGAYTDNQIFDHRNAFRDIHYKSSIGARIIVDISNSKKTIIQ